MNKIRIIDLLNKIANGEEVPNKIIYKDKIYNFNCADGDYFDNENSEYLLADLFERCYTQDFINDIVEIIEEPRDIEVCGSLFTKSEYDKLAHSEEKKIPKKLYKYKENDDECCFEDILKVYEGGEYEITEDISFIVDKINEIIDYLKSKGE